MHFLFAVITLAVSSATCGTPSERASITAAIKAEQPADTKVGTITTAGNYADVTVIWHGGDAAGTVLLAKRNGAWRVLTSTGGAYDQGTMRQYGIPAGAASTLSKAVSNAVCFKG